MITFLCAILVVLFDQLTKYWAASSLAKVGEIPLIRGVLYFTYTRNAGAAFGILKEHRWVFLVFTLAVIVAVIGYLVFTRSKKKHPLLLVSLGLILGGGIGNMIDRLFFGETFLNGTVIDFIDFRLINFAVFNVADAAVCIGEALLLIYVFFFEYKKEADKETKKEPDDAA